MGRPAERICGGEPDLAILVAESAEKDRHEQWPATGRHGTQRLEGSAADAHVLVTCRLLQGRGGSAEPLVRARALGWERFFCR